jgi:hypothetical protein
MHHPPTAIAETTVSVAALTTVAATNATAAIPAPVPTLVPTTVTIAATTLAIRRRSGRYYCPGRLVGSREN